MSTPAPRISDPPLWQGALKRGLRRGVDLIWLLLKFILPFYVLSALLKQSGVLGLVSGFLEPVMGLWNLPPEAAAVLTAGMLVNLYAAVAVAAPLGLNWVQISVLGLILGIAHNLVVEGAVMRQLAPGRLTFLSLLRLGMGLVAGLVLAWLLG